MCASNENADGPALSYQMTSYEAAERTGRANDENHECVRLVWTALSVLYGSSGSARRLKAIACVLPVHPAQLLSCLLLSGRRVGLLINFHVPRLRDRIHRMLNGPPGPP